MDLRPHVVHIALARLRQRARGEQRLGARVHGWRLRPVLPVEEVAAFEAAHNITLPADYRSFITRIGNGGAGPAYGLFPLGEFVMSGQRFDLPRLDVRFRPSQGTAGALPISEQGCANSHWLGISGPERGIVWTDARANDGGLHPAVVPQPHRILRRRQTFSEWYGSWLEHMLDKHLG